MLEHWTLDEWIKVAGVVKDLGAVGGLIVTTVVGWMVLWRIRGSEPK